jgi:hypothetical protein
MIDRHDVSLRAESTAQDLGSLMPYRAIQDDLHVAPQLLQFSRHGVAFHLGARITPSPGAIDSTTKPASSCGYGIARPARKGLGSLSISRIPSPPAAAKRCADARSPISR